MSKRRSEFSKIVKDSPTKIDIVDALFSVCPDAFLSILRFTNFQENLQLSTTCKLFRKFIVEEKEGSFPWFIPNLETLCESSDVDAVYKIYQFPRYPKLKDYFISYQFTESTFLRDKMNENEEGKKRKSQLLTEITTIQAFVRSSSSFLGKNVLGQNRNQYHDQYMQLLNSPDSNLKVSYDEMLETLSYVMLYDQKYLKTLLHASTFARSSRFDPMIQGNYLNLMQFYPNLGKKLPLRILSRYFFFFLSSLTILFYPFFISFASLFLPLFSHFLSFFFLSLFLSFLFRN